MLENDHLKYTTFSYTFQVSRLKSKGPRVAPLHSWNRTKMHELFFSLIKYSATDRREKDKRREEKYVGNEFYRTPLSSQLRVRWPREANASLQLKRLWWNRPLPHPLQLSILRRPNPQKRERAMYRTSAASIPPVSILHPLPHSGIQRPLRKRGVSSCYIQKAIPTTECKNLQCYYRLRSRTYPPKKRLCQREMETMGMSKPFCCETFALLIISGNAISSEEEIWEIVVSQFTLWCNIEGGERSHFVPNWSTVGDFGFTDLIRIYLG